MPSISDSVQMTAEYTMQVRHIANLESEVKGRVNGLIFLVAGTVEAQVILKVVG